MTLRALNEGGIKQFAMFYDDLKGGKRPQLPSSILTDRSLTVSIEAVIDLEERVFESRYEFGVYLNKKLESLFSLQLESKVWKGVYDWISLFYFDEICPPDKDGNRDVKEMARYIASNETSDSFREYYRHLVSEPHRLVRLHGDKAKVLLHNPLHLRGDFAEQISGRQEWVTSRGFMEALDLLYYSKKRGAPKRGAQTRGKPGTLRRFGDVMNQLMLTYDIYSIEGKRIIQLLPKEFDRWLKKK